MSDRTFNFLKQHIPKNSTIVIAVSGGADSVYLLHQCLELEKAYPFRIVVAHLNHTLRKKESDRDALFVKKLAHAYKLPFHLETLKKLPKGNLEEVCRIKRYEFLEKIRKKTQSDWILTAHHQNDNIETVLFNMVRGSFLGGLKGISMVSPKRHLLRPLLTTPKKEILQYLKKHRLSFCQDSSNKDLKFSRNLIRQKVIPQFQKINPHFEETFTKNLSNFQETEAYLEETAEKWLTKNTSDKGISLAAFLKLKSILQKIVVAQLYRNLYGTTTKFNLRHLDQILKILRTQKKKSKKEFGDTYYIVITAAAGQKFISFQKK